LKDFPLSLLIDQNMLLLIDRYGNPIQNLSILKDVTDS
jgi:hypothetical protein